MEKKEVRTAPRLTAAANADAKASTSHVPGGRCADQMELELGTGGVDGG